MVKHNQTICQQQLTNCLSVFNHFAVLALKGLITIILFFDAPYFSCSLCYKWTIFKNFKASLEAYFLKHNFHVFTNGLYYSHMCDYVYDLYKVRRTNQRTLGTYINNNYTNVTKSTGDTRVQFNNSWFAFHDSSWGFHKPYLSRKHIFQELYRVNKTQFIVFNPANKYQDFWRCNNFKKILVNDFQHHPFLYQTNVL